MSKDFNLKGIFLEACRKHGHCPLWFGRDIVEDKPCESMVVLKIEEGQIKGICVDGISLIYMRIGLGPKVPYTTIKWGASYVSRNINEEQKTILEYFASRQIGTEMIDEFAGVKFCELEVEIENGLYHVKMPFGEVRMAHTVGGDGINPIIMHNNKLDGVREDPRMLVLKNAKFCNTDYWKYHDHGYKLEYHTLGGTTGDFYLVGDYKDIRLL